MAITFNKSKGSAIKNTVEAYAYKDNENTVRLVGGVLARYVYWLKGTNGKDIPVECLSFDRDEEKFTNVEVDHVPAFFPDKKCQWAYCMNGIDPSDGKVKVVHLKKKLFQAIMDAAETLGDPTDPDTGFDIVFKRIKTGPATFNVEYTLSTLKLKKRSLTEDERVALAEAKSIDEKYPRQTADQVLALLQKMTSGGDDTDEAGDEATREAVNELS